VIRGNSATPHRVVDHPRKSKLLEDGQSTPDVHLRCPGVVRPPLGFYLFYYYYDF
jgi:hypothetical protein